MSPAPVPPVLLLDIEGTTTAISFVTDVLFPASTHQVDAYLTAHAADPAVISATALIQADATADERARLSDQALTAAVVKRQVAADVKAPGLKALQGLIWDAGYRNGSIKGHVYDDVPTVFAAVKAAGRTLAIYSSGSVLAQKLIFGYSIAGDLTPYISAHFDTAVGNKREAKSYTAIAAALGVAPGDIRFCTDIVAEAEAARAAGLDAVVLLRPGNAPLPAGVPFPIHADLRRV